MDQSENMGPVATQHFQWPFQPKAGVVAADWYEALSRSTDGFYLLGRNGLWHGGVHLHAGLVSTLTEDPTVRCMADGEVIAYRVDDRYPSVDFPGSGKAHYSSGFVLVRHRLQPPRARQSDTDRDQTPPGLTLYSLYMHLLDWEGYQANRTVPRPGFWETPENSFIVADAANDPNPYAEEPTEATGIRVRQAGRGSPVCGWLPRGSRLTVEDGSTPWRNIRSIVSGTMVRAPLTEPTTVAPLGTVFTGELDSAPAEPKERGEIHVPPLPIPIRAGDVIGHLGLYQRRQDLHPLSGASSDRMLTHIEVFSPDDVPTFIAASRAYAARLGDAANTLLLVERGASLRQVSAPDVELGSHEAVLGGARGSSTGWVHVQRATRQVVPRNALPGYNSGARTYANGARLLRILDASGGSDIDEAEFNALSATGKSGYPNREVWMPAGGEVWVQSSQLDGRGFATGQPIMCWTHFPLQQDGDGAEVAETVVVPIEDLEGEAVREADGTRWFKIEVRQADGLDVAGWVRERAHGNVRVCSPWEWPGLELLESDGVAPSAYYAHHLSTHPGTPTGERPALAEQGEAASRCPLLVRLNALVDADGNGHLSTREITAAAKDRSVAGLLSNLVVRHWSEWNAGAADWNGLGPLAGSEAYVDWSAERERIDRLQWWSRVLPELPNARPWHFHLAGLASRLGSPTCRCSAGISADQLRAIAPYASGDNIRRYVDPLNQMFARYGLSTCMNKVHLLAQLLHESGSLQFNRELGGPFSYDPWRGRGLIQITFEQNYRSYGDYIGEDFTSSDSARRKLEEPPHSVLSAGWYWTQYKAIAPHADEDDFLWCTAVVNGAFNGHDHRLSFVNRAIQELGLQACARKNRSGEYQFEESAVYNNRRYSFAWGLWHDPASNKGGVSKSAAKAIAGYRRYLSLHDQAGRPAEPGSSGAGPAFWYALRVPSYRRYAIDRISDLETLE